MDHDLYKLPLYYDVAFGWDEIGYELDCLEACFGYADGPVVRLLEPGCGTGRFLAALTERGYRVTGYDRSPEMLAYARERIGSGAEAVEGDMTGARFDPPFDAAYCAVNTLGYLTTDEEILAHFDTVADSLRPGGVYAVQIAFAYGAGEIEPPDEWECERDGIRTKTHWCIEREDEEARIAHHHCRIEVTEDGRETVFEERQRMRLWLYSDWLRLIEENGRFTRAAVRSTRGRVFDLTAELNGHDGNLYHVLKRRRP